MKTCRCTPYYTQAACRARYEPYPEDRWGFCPACNEGYDPEENKCYSFTHVRA